jgi:hypothetical protein
VWLLHCYGEFARKEDMLVEINAGLGMGVRNGNFIALILRMKLTRLMINAELNKRYSVEGLLTELEKIKIMILPDGEKITTESFEKPNIKCDLKNACQYFRSI